MLLKSNFQHRSIDKDRINNFFLNLSYSQRINLRGRGCFDLDYINTNGDKWVSREHGRSIVFRFDNKFIKNKSLPSYKNLIKWAVSQFITSYSLMYALDLYYKLGEFIDFINLREFTFEECLGYLEKVSEQKDGDTSSSYFAFKRFIRMLIEIETPGFLPEDIFLLEQSPVPETINWDAYYDLELKLKPYECAFIQKGISRDNVNLNDLTYSELLETIIISICYEVGLRGCQLYKLHDDNFISIDNKYYSIVRPLAKLGNFAQHQGTDRVQISKETGRFIETLQKKRNGIGQLLRDENNSLTYGNHFNLLINKALHRWGASRDVNFTTYDFRHNVGHTLAMQGSSAEEIAFILGHNNTVVARHYISSTPEIAKRKQLALGGNKFYQQMIGMIMTGEIVKEDNWNGKHVVGEVGSQLCTGIGGCAADSCKYHPVHSCYSCKDYNPFLNGHHQQVLDALREQVNEVMTLSDSVGQIKENPAISILEGTIAQVKAVISRCAIDEATMS